MSERDYTWHHPYRYGLVVPIDQLSPADSEIKCLPKSLDDLWDQDKGWWSSDNEVIDRLATLVEERWFGEPDPEAEFQRFIADR